ncbi:alkaline phosphatase D family protein [Pontibacter sp. G13]|uniref:alkaline phosphatase D family protein n=1 Tax=Pontibacter sp. G13 TaxID=3074898 RepID=UPI00288B37CF|nr:alkaline phosphatase D family protein [Pontibacter sp. G13]WNJ21302.1 alkaline phosphatase D family protein [Pontibacter sp. G13]
MKRISPWLFGCVLMASVGSCDIEPTSQATYESLSGYPEPRDLFQDALKPFYHGVASGDPLQDRVILWTRISPEHGQDSISGTWEIAEDTAFSQLTNQGDFTTSSARDFTVKIDAMGLKAGQVYYYRFLTGEYVSPVGRTKTLPSGDVSEVKLAIATCSNLEGGYFNAYRQMTAQDLDAVVHLGDYIYEYGPGHYADSNLVKSGRANRPAKEIVSLADYRLRYSTYRTDADLQAVHQHLPFINIWDDHESANNSYMEGAQNHQAGEGDWKTRMEAAQQAYFEWLPIRDDESYNIYRAFQFGDLMSLIMVDTRLVGRSAQLDSITDPSYQDESRTLMGPEQMAWFEAELTQSTTWKVIGNQVMVSPMDISFMGNGNREVSYYAGKERNLDQWDGYPAEKRRLFDMLDRNEVSNLIFLTGDDHASFAYEVVPDDQFKSYNPEAPEGAIAVELVTPSISSPNFDEEYPADVVEELTTAYLAPENNPHLRWTDLIHHGFVRLTITPEQSRADWYFVETVDAPTNEGSFQKSYLIPLNQNRLIESESGS